MYVATSEWISPPHLLVFARNRARRPGRGKVEFNLRDSQPRGRDCNGTTGVIGGGDVKETTFHKS
jgi:hypothetical protein